MNLKQKIIRELRDTIIKGEYPPGTHLVESEVSDRFKVSRTPVREALNQLEKEGFVRITPDAGARVVELSVQDVSDIYDVLIVLEGAASRLACSRINDGQLAKLAEYNFLFEKSLGSRNTELFSELNNRFHWLITSATGNAHLMEMRSNFRDLIHRILHTFPHIPGQLEATVAEHQQIIAALQARNPSLAEFVMREHLENAKIHLLAYLHEDRLTGGKRQSREGRIAS